MKVKEKRGESEANTNIKIITKFTQLHSTLMASIYYRSADGHIWCFCNYETVTVENENVKYLLLYFTTHKCILFLTSYWVFG